MGYNKLAVSSWGYHVKEKDNHIYFTNTYERKRTLIKEYKKIICLWNVFYQMTKDDCSYFVEKMFDIWNDYLKEQNYYFREGAKIYVTPLIVCLCLSNLPYSVIKTYLLPLHSIFLLNHEKKIIKEMSLALIRDLYGNDYEFNKECSNYAQLIDSFLSY